MDLMRNWPQIKAVFRQSFFFVVSTVREDGSPHACPIGSIFLRNDGTGFYFEMFTRTTPKNFGHTRRLCVTAINTSLRFWLFALLQGRFPSPPAVRVLGTAKERREAHPQEVQWWQRRTRHLRWMKGYKLLWSDLRIVRELEFDAFEPVLMGKMTHGLWQ